MRRSRMTDSSTERARPKMVYSPVCAIESADNGVGRVLNGLRLVPVRMVETVIAKWSGRAIAGNLYYTKRSAAVSSPPPTN